MTELKLLVKAIIEDLGDPSDWRPPVEFRDSLALCALNSAYSLRGAQPQRRTCSLGTVRFAQRQTQTVA